ncbi:pyrroloquinoline quinone biosynthesis protein PqqE [Methylibium sp. Root1272]|uniref:pyrroloquinoline quinone biosynthesis protein PqqE n=1 Tax=Methylibium sp. Root1272 TaxID=1736441 RepID=UPI0006FD10BC|nr:pyrroloquinoline quinone biosynthesis protein PqqE [Methylibium sp. Root1272]KQW66255.1 pyrroloquinoline quinone biosynthesis protein PqqE [Methylibium sp. Root1272]
MGVPSGQLRSAPGAPMWLLAELTYKCPLHCVFCSNPTDYADHLSEIGTEDWKRVFREARKMGAVQLGFSGGEPLLRDDLEELVAEARQLGYYTNLITSGIGLTEKRARALKDAGLDHIQLSFQDSTKELNDFLSSTRTFDHKNKVAAIIKSLGYPMVLNCVMHRYNLPHVDRIIGMAEAMGADFLELANTQYYGWAWLNRAALMPTPDELHAAEAIVDSHRQRLAGRMKILWVSPDYVDAKPKPCMAGWGAVFMVIAPDGTALPCHSARMLPGFDFPKVTEHSISSIWRDSDAFNRYRGTSWMSDTCLSCDQHPVDHGGCRCQAFLVTGDAAATDPVCPKSPDRHLIDAALDAAVAQAGSALSATPQPLRFVPGAARSGDLWYRTDANSRTLSDDGHGPQHDTEPAAAETR